MKDRVKKYLRINNVDMEKEAPGFLQEQKKEEIITPVEMVADAKEHYDPEDLI